MDWDEFGTVSRWWFYWKCLDGLWQGLAVNGLLAILSSVLSVLHGFRYEQEIKGALAGLFIMAVIQALLIWSQHRELWRTEIPRKPLTRKELNEFASLLKGVRPRDILIVRNDFATDCVALSRQLQNIFRDMEWEVKTPSQRFEEYSPPGICVRSVDSDKVTADRIKAALTKVLGVSIGSEDGGARNLDWIEIEIGSVL